MINIPEDAWFFIIEQSTLVAEDFLEQGIHEKESMDPVVTTHTLFWRHTEGPILADIGICFFMDDYIAKIVSAKFISEDEYADLCIDHHHSISHSS